MTATPTGPDAIADGPPETTSRFAAFQSPSFRLLMAAGMAMQLGQWIQRVALLWVVYEITGSAVSLGALAFLSNIFVILLSPFVGVVSDRLGARRVLMIAAVGQAVAASALAGGIFTGHASLTLLYGTAVTFGIGQALNGPTRNLLVYDAVGRDLLRNGLALNAITGNTMRVIGPTIGGLIVGIWGGGPAFALQAVLLVGAVGLVWALKVESRRTAARGGVWSELTGGVRHVAGNPMVRTSIIIAGLTAAFVYPYVSFMPVFVDRNLHGGATEQGILLSAVGVGSLIGLWYVAAGRGGMRSMLWSSAAYMALVVAFAQATDFWVAVGILIAAGVVHSVFSTLNQALVQLNAQEEYRARTLGIYSMVSGFEPLSVLALGPLIERIGASYGMGLYAGFATLVTLGFAVAASVSARRRAAAAPGRGSGTSR